VNQFFFQSNFGPCDTVWRIACLCSLAWSIQSLSINFPKQGWSPEEIENIAKILAANCVGIEEEKKNDDDDEVPLRTKHAKGSSFNVLPISVH